jgi:hypothetical protein
MYRTNGYKTMKIFEETAPADWVLFYSFDSPLPEFFPYITSPEPFVCGGKSYISFMAAQSESGKDGMPAQIWVAHAGPADSSMWRVSDSSLAVRTDPEPVVFSDSAFVYYSHVVIDEHSTEKYVVRKCDTGLSNFTTVNLKPQEPAGKLSVYPNPGNGFFTLNTSLEMGANPLLKISDASGRLMLSRIIEFFPATIDLREVPSGVYILTLSGEKQSLSTRIQVAAGK